MPGAGLFAWLRALGNSRKCLSPRVPRSGGRGLGEGRPVPGCEPPQRALTAACSRALTRASERPAPHEPLTPRIRNPSFLVSGTPNLSPQEALASGTPIPLLRNPSPRFLFRKGSFGARGMGRSRCPLTFVQVRDLPAAAVPCQSRKEGKVSVVAANAAARPFPLPRPSHIQAITFRQVGLLH